MIGEIRLPWPSRELHPNARIHWARKAKLTKKAREEAYWATRAAGLTKLDLSTLKATVAFNPPDKRRRDADGVLSSCKAYLDGVSDAVGVDDSNWQIAIRRNEPVKLGAVRIILEVV